MGKQVEVKVAVCVPCMEDLKSMFCYDFFRMGCYNTKRGIKMGVFFSQGSLIQQQRERLVDTVMQDPAFTHIMWLDSDMRFPPEVIERLLDHDVPAVCASYPTRKGNAEPVAFADLSDFSKRVWTPPDAHGLGEIGACGFGCFLVRRDVVEAMSKPRFMVGYNTNNDTFLGEDIYFFIKMWQELKLRLLIDHDLTKDIRHIGTKEWDNNDALAALQLGIERGEATLVEPQQETT